MQQMGVEVKNCLVAGRQRLARFGDAALGLVLRPVTGWFESQIGRSIFLDGGEGDGGVDLTKAVEELRREGVL